jgi:elongation of very long chain fatty acids protein 4
MVKTMERRQALELKGVMRVYNFAQVLVNVYIVALLMPEHMPLNLFGINKPYSANTRYAVFLHYCCKFVDFLDTVFILLRKKDAQFSFLHVYHHSTIGIMWGFLLNIGHGNGTASFGAWINSLVHVVMYGHYFYTSFGLRNPLKAYITSFQITQFYLCLLHVVMVLLFETVVPKQLGYLQFAYHITMVALFTRFFVKSYSGKGKKTLSSKAD